MFFLTTGTLHIVAFTSSGASRTCYFHSFPASSHFLPILLSIAYMSLFPGSLIWTPWFEMKCPFLGLPQHPILLQVLSLYSVCCPPGYIISPKTICCLRARIDHICSATVFPIFVIVPNTLEILRRYIWNVYSVLENIRLRGRTLDPYCLNLNPNF